MSPPDSPQRDTIVRILQDYILDCVGALAEAEERATRNLVQKAFGKTPDWKQKLRDELGLTGTIDDQIRQMWKAGQALALSKGATLEAQDFASAVVEENFLETVEMLVTEAEMETQDMGKK